MNSFLVFAGNSNPELAKEICESLGIPLGKSRVRRFSDGEIRVEIDENVRKRDVFIIQTTDSDASWLELLIMASALKYSSAGSITAVMPYYGYARQDKKDRPRVPISARLFADLLQTAGVQRGITMDLHAGQIQGFFGFPTDHLFAMPVILEDVKKNSRARICPSCHQMQVEPREPEPLPRDWARVWL